VAPGTWASFPRSRWIHEVDGDFPLPPRLEHDEHAPGIRRIARAAEKATTFAHVWIAITC